MQAQTITNKMAANEQDIDFAKKIATNVEELQAECIEIRMGASGRNKVLLFFAIKEKRNIDYDEFFMATFER